MRWALIKDGNIEKVVSKLEKEYNNGISKFPLNTLWREGKDSVVNSLGWFACKEIEPDYNKWTHKPTKTADTVLIDKLPVSTIILEELTDEEINDKIFNAKLSLRTQAKELALRDMNKILPAIDTFDSVCLIKLLWDSLSHSARTNNSALMQILDIYQSGLTQLALIDTFTTVTQVTSH